MTAWQMTRNKRLSGAIPVTELSECWPASSLAGASARSPEQSSESATAAIGGPMAISPAWWGFSTDSQAVLWSAFLADCCGGHRGIQTQSRLNDGMSEPNHKQTVSILARAGMLTAIIFTAGLTGEAAWILLPFGAAHDLQPSWWSISLLSTSRCSSSGERNSLAAPD